MPNPFTEYIEYMASTIEKALKGDHLIHGCMIYRCNNCGAVYFMHLERGLEDSHITREHKPVPHSFPCILCFGPTSHILIEKTSDTYGENYRSYSNMINEKNVVILRNFFWNDPESKCGVPVLFEPDIYNTTYTSELGKIVYDSIPMESLNPDFCVSSLGICYEDGLNREQRRHGELGYRGYKRPRNNNKFYDYRRN